MSLGLLTLLWSCKLKEICLVQISRFRKYNNDIFSYMDFILKTTVRFKKSSALLINVFKKIHWINMQNLYVLRLLHFEQSVMKTMKLQLKFLILSRKHLNLRLQQNKN